MGNIHIEPTTQAYDAMKATNYPRNPDGFGRFYQDSVGIVTRRYLSLGERDPELLADAIHDVYIVLFERLDGLRGDVANSFTGAPTFGWVTQAVNWRLNNLRRREIGSDGGQRFTRLDTLRLGIDMNLESVEANVILDTVLPKLPEGEREVLEARREDFETPLKDIGLEMGIDEDRARYLNKQGMAHARVLVTKGSLRKQGRPKKSFQESLELTA
ncbi:MAG TPA: sigma-70 family RNA polymerase sigma factor [Patescibacteria group bacterium]|nr:sigma-70 family RNA polymerase sigma factor [Patescibacteria group bacterium]